jgi:flagellar biosynthetic protein FlhB
MADDFDNGDKTELPTERRRREIRERGIVARSVDLNAAAAVLAAAAALHFFGDDLSRGMVDVLRKSLSAPAWVELNVSHFVSELWRLAAIVAQALLPGLALLVASSVLVNAAQVGFLLSTDAITPRLERINPWSGLRRLFSLSSTVRLAGSTLKVAVAGAIVAGFVTGRLPEIVHALDADTAAFCRQTGSWLVSLSFQLGLGLVALAALDYGFQLWKFESDIKMTKQEVRDELRHMEGDPQLRQRRREAHRKLVNARHVQQTKEADLVITGPGEIAVAIKYDRGRSDAPRVLSLGKGPLAARIWRMAAEGGIPIVENGPLAQSLQRTGKAGQAIPNDLFEAVAEVLASVERVSGNRAQRA